MSEIDPRPANCRFRLQDEGKPYPKSGCASCGATVATGLGKTCRAALSFAAVAEREPVAWRWKPKDSETWIYDPEHEWLEAQSRDEIDAEPLYLDPPPTSELEAENARLRAERDSLLNGHRILNVSCSRLQDRAEAAEARLAEALKAMEPFPELFLSFVGPANDEWFNRFADAVKNARRVREGGKA